MFRTKPFRRNERKKHINRRKNTCRAIYGSTIGGVVHPGAWYEHDGQYSKGKIYCSCKLCRYSRHYGLPTVADMRESEAFAEALNDYETSKGE